MYQHELHDEQAMPMPICAMVHDMPCRLPDLHHQTIENARSLAGRLLSAKAFATDVFNHCLKVLAGCQIYITRQLKTHGS